MIWYPNGLGYKLGTDRRNIRKVQALQGLHQWMIQHTDNGNITRQEAVSMVPPLALDVQPFHKCLDMCAAPGSKTSQLLEVIEQSVHGPVNMQGLVVANDSDTDRAYMLVHQCKRINSPLLVITTHKGQIFPRIRNMTDDATDSIDNIKSEKDGYFDRVLCDVPCSGSVYLCVCLFV
jgi:16S rRNA C967 or C1407 C5-methylase (RsmB/RsmF family)